MFEAEAYLDQETQSTFVLSDPTDEWFQLERCLDSETLYNRLLAWRTD